MAFEEQPAVRPVGAGELIEQARLAHARLSEARHDLTMPRPSSCQCLVELLQLGITPHNMG